jgi:hypothetical protein
VRIPIGVAVDVALDPARHDLGVAVVAVGVLDEVAHQQRHIHHEAVHAILRISRHLSR